MPQTEQSALLLSGVSSTEYWIVRVRSSFPFTNSAVPLTSLPIPASFNGMASVLSRSSAANARVEGGAPLSLW